MNAVSKFIFSNIFLNEFNISFYASKCDIKNYVFFKPDLSTTKGNCFITAES